MPTEHDAVRLLEELGLTEYEARCFVALTRVTKATAKEVSDLSEVPRSRVYDAVERLHQRGLVDVQQSEPREYQSIDADRAIATLEEQYQSTLDDASRALEDLAKVDNPEETGAWAIADADHVADRVETIVDDANETLYLLVVDEAFANGEVDAILDGLDDRGVQVTAEVPSEELEAVVRDAAPEATVAVSDLAADPAAVENKWLGGILLADGRAVLISAMTETVRPDDPEETAIWASGTNHGLVVGLRHLLGSRDAAVDE